jgi:hypothetical protein
MRVANFLDRLSILSVILFSRLPILKNAPITMHVSCFNFRLGVGDGISRRLRHYRNTLPRGQKQQSVGPLAGAPENGTRKSVDPDDELRIWTREQKVQHVQVIRILIAEGLLENKP